MRTPKIWKRKGSDWWFTTVGTNKVRLSKDRKEAQRLFHELKGEPETKAGGPSFRKLADLFIEDSRHREPPKAPETIEVQQRHIQTFIDHIKGKRCTDLKPLDVTEWIVTKDWSASMRSGVRSTIKAVLNWGVDQGVLKENPLARMKVGSGERRERILSPEERRLVLPAIEGSLYDFVFVLEQTGARPFSETAKITASMVDFAGSTVTFKKHKNARKGKKRVMYCTPAVLAVLRRLALKYPDGPLFRNRLGAPWKANTLYYRLHEIAKQVGIPPFPTYSLRHAFCTEAMERGVSAEMLAELVGNSPQTLFKHYLHFQTRKKAMLDAAARAVS